MKSPFVWSGWALPLLVIAAACGTAPVDDELAADLPADSDYPLLVGATGPASGDRWVAVTLTNSGALQLTFNLCYDGTLERRTGRGWVALPRDTTPCPSIGLGLDPGQVAQSAIRFIDVPETGEYRVRVEIAAFRSSERVVRRSNPFSVP